MYYRFMGCFYATKEEAEKIKEDYVKNGLCAKDEPIITKKLW